MKIKKSKMEPNELGSNLANADAKAKFGEWNYGGLN